MSKLRRILAAASVAFAVTAGSLAIAVPANAAADPVPGCAARLSDFVESLGSASGLPGVVVRELTFSHSTLDTCFYVGYRYAAGIRAGLYRTSVARG